MIEGSGTGDDAHPPWPGQGQPFAGETAGDGAWFAWRLSGANHRELGRSTAVHAELAHVLRAIAELRSNAERAVVGFVMSPSGAHWTWRMTIDGEPVAMSSRAYFRQRECAYAAAAFSAAIGVATIPTVSGRRHKSLQMNDRRTPHDHLGYGLPAQTESPDPPLSVNLGRTPS